MSLNVTFNGVVYIIPETGEVGWGGNVTSYLVALAAGALQKTGGSFTLSAETDFGASFGLKSLYYKSRSANVASTGIVRLANNSDSVSFRNAANSADLPLTVDASDRLSYNGVPVLTGTTPSSYVSSITGTINQVNASASTGAVTLSLPQSIDIGAAVQFGTLGLGSAIVTSAILSLTSTISGFLPPRMTTVQRDLIVSPATGLFIYNTSTGVNNYYNGSAWVAIAAGGTINAGTQYQLAYYASNGTTLSGLTLITASRALASDADGLPVASATTAAELAFVSGVTSAIQTQLNLKAPLASPTFTGTVTIPSPFTLGATSVTASGTELNYLIGVTSAIQTQLNAKATDSLVVHLAGTETITGAKDFSTQTLFSNGTAGTPSIAFTNATSTGLYLIGTGPARIGITTDGVSRVSIADSSITLTIPIYSADGTVSSPGIGFSSDANSGMYRIGTDNIAMGTNGIRALEITSAQAVKIKGTSTNDNATAGDVGEYVESTVLISSSVSMGGTGVGTDVTSITLTAGDWDLTGLFNLDPNGATVSYIEFRVGTVAGNNTTGMIFGVDRITGYLPTATVTGGALGTYETIRSRYSISSTTTYYLKFGINYTVATPKGFGRISARRMR